MALRLVYLTLTRVLGWLALLARSDVAKDVPDSGRAEFGAARSGSAWTCLAWIESCFSVVTVWHALHGHCVDDVISHRTRACWYTTKTDPSYDDMTVKFRRVIIAARIGSPCPEQATPQEPGLRSLGRCGAHDQQEPRNTKPPGRF